MSVIMIFGRDNVRGTANVLNYSSNGACCWCPGDELEAEENFRTAEIGSATCILLLTGFVILSAIYAYRFVAICIEPDRLQSPAPCSLSAAESALRP